MEITYWEKEKPINPDEMMRELQNEGLLPYIWQDGIGAFYPTHSHPYKEIRWIVSGSVTFGVKGEEITLYPGDRLELPANTPHYAKMSDQSITTYLCASKE